MQISVTGPAGLLTDQVRAYAEYRLFTTLARYAPLVRGATVSLERDDGLTHGPVSCVIDVDLGASRPLRCRSTEPHAAEAIDRGAEWARRALERRARRLVQ